MIDYKKKYIKYKFKYLNLIGGVLPKCLVTPKSFFFDTIFDLLTERSDTIQKFESHYEKIIENALQICSTSELEPELVKLLLLFEYVKESLTLLKRSIEDDDSIRHGFINNINEIKKKLEGNTFGLNFDDLLNVWIEFAEIIKKQIEEISVKPSRNVVISSNNYNSRKFLIFPALFLKKAVEIFKTKTDITEETTKRLKNLEELSTEILELYIPPFSNLLAKIYDENQKMVKYLKSCQFQDFIKKFNSFRKNINSLEASSANIVILLTDFLEVWNEAKKCNSTIACPNLDNKPKNEIKISELLELLVPIGQGFLDINITYENKIKFDNLKKDLEKKIQDTKPKPGFFERLLNKKS
jgi:hypothetical protein